MKRTAPTRTAFQLGTKTPPVRSSLDHGEPQGARPIGMQIIRGDLVRGRFEAILGRDTNTYAFICGSAANENEVWDLFDVVIYLAVDERTLRHRLANRSGNDFGKEEHELRAILEWHRTGVADYTRYGAVVIDATQSLEAVVDKVVAVAIVEGDVDVSL